MFSYINKAIEFLVLIFIKLFFLIKNNNKIIIDEIINEKFFFIKKNFSFIAKVFI